MQNCGKCRITVRGYKSCCPLCGGPLQGEPEKPAFPVLEEKHVSRITLLKVTGFLLILFFAVMLVIQLIVGRMFSWMPLAVLIGGIALADVWAAGTLVRNVLKLITSQVCVGMLLCVIVDIYFGWRGWSVSYVLPVAALALTGLTFLISLVGRAELQDFVMYLVFDLVVTYVQLIFLLLKKNPHPTPAVLSMTIPTVVLLAIVIFFRKDFRSALSRYFNT
jgi:hypothetical protein